MVYCHVTLLMQGQYCLAYCHVTLLVLRYHCHVAVTAQINSKTDIFRNRTCAKPIGLVHATPVPSTPTSPDGGPLHQAFLAGPARPPRARPPRAEPFSPSSCRRASCFLALLYLQRRPLGTA